MITHRLIPKSKKAILPNGIRILTEKIPVMRSVAVGIVVGAGSGNEKIEERGLSHFIEHMTFKGTPTRTAHQIAQEIDAVGGKINAFTGKEYTCYYSVILDEHVDIAIGVLADIFLNSLYDPKGIELEKGVVLEEIKMYEDTPDELIHDFFASTIFSHHPLGQATIGVRDTVKTLSRESITRYRKNLYTPENVIIAIAGNVDHDRMVRRTNKLFGGLAGKKVFKTPPPPKISPHISVMPKKTAQAHLCLGTKGIAHLDEERYIFAIMDNILGGNMSSRLFQEVRERRGLVYAIYSYNSAFKDFGTFAIYAGTSKENLKQVVDLILAEFAKVKKEGITKEELQRAKEYLKGNLVLGLESTSARMSWMAKSEFYYGRVQTIDEIFAMVDKVTQDDIIKLANEYLINKYLNLATIGDFKPGEKPVKEIKC